MAKRTDIKKILIIGSGPIVIGQAAEFDYAGTQACLALREEGYEVVLCNSNPATIMTDTVIADKATVTGNKYQISGDYIGSTLTCQLSSGNKTSEQMSVAITKTGATVTLEETVIKLKVQLNTANAKQWWGNTMKIHVWNTGTSFDTSWPGNTMTSEGNYTWSIIVPSELVGKTINFLVHNGNGWQSSDSKVTIKPEGVTVNGSSIGIN